MKKEMTRGGSLGYGVPGPAHVFSTSWSKLNTSFQCHQQSCPPCLPHRDGRCSLKLWTNVDHFPTSCFQRVCSQQHESNWCWKPVPDPWNHCRTMQADPQGSLWETLGSGNKVHRSMGNKACICEVWERNCATGYPGYTWQWTCLSSSPVLKTWMKRNFKIKANLFGRGNFMIV